MSRDIRDRKHFQETIAADERVCALFFATWCPYSRRFLPEFEKAADLYGGRFACVRIDDLDDLSEEYDVNVYPTVIFFEKGQASDRVDGVLGVGIDVGRFLKAAETCVSGKGKK